VNEAKQFAERGEQTLRAMRTPITHRIVGGLVTAILLVPLAAVLVKTAEIAWAWVS